MNSNCYNCFTYNTPFNIITNKNYSITLYIHSLITSIYPIIHLFPAYSIKMKNFGIAGRNIDVI